MGNCCGKTAVDNSPGQEKCESDKNNNKKIISNNNSKSSRLSRKSNISIETNYSSYTRSDKYEEEDEEEEIFRPKYFSFKQFFEEEESHTLNDYHFLQSIGSGAMSTVYQIEVISTKEILAAKVYNLNQLCKPTLGNEDPPIKAVQDEIDLMSKMSNIYILMILDAFEYRDANSLVLVFPFAKNGNVQSLLDKNLLKDKNIIVCFHQIAIALQYMHSSNIVHRDIKPENILCFSEDYYVLSDFSVSSEFSDDNQYFEDTKGSPAFLSPEECSGDPFLPKPADVWAYGVSFYCAIFGFLPFKLDLAENRSIANTIIVVTEMLQTQKLTFPKKTINGNPVDKEVVSLLKEVLNKDPKKRPTFDKVLKSKCFKDAWPIHEANLKEDQLLIEKENQEIENQDKENNENSPD